MSRLAIKKGRVLAYHLHQLKCCGLACLTCFDSAFLHAGSMTSESSDVTDFRAVCVRQPPQSIDLSCEESTDDLGTFDSPCWQSERMRFGMPHSPGNARISFEVSTIVIAKRTPGMCSLRLGVPILSCLTVKLADSKALCGGFMKIDITV